MGTIKKYRYQFLAIIVANIILLRLNYWDYGKIRITYFHVVVGILPIVILIIRILKEKMNEQSEG